MSHSVHIVASFVRTWLLARWLPVETFGVYSFATSLVALTGMVSQFGMGGAFLHRCAETEDEDQAAAVHFTLNVITTVIWAVVMLIIVFASTHSETRLALLVLTGTTSGMQLTQTLGLILQRRVMHRRLAILEATRSLCVTGVALGLALRGQTLWALLSMDVVTMLLYVGFLYIWRPVWRPRLVWIPTIMNYFLSFGSRNLMANVLLRALDKVDDLWTGIYLGDRALGFYSRAYAFASYPRQILATPIDIVIEATFAELKNDRPRLSKVFFYTNVLLVRSSFFLAGVLSLIAPEFIRLFLGEKWLPMLTVFRLMLVFTLLDPLKLIVGRLFVAVGKPELMVKVRLCQLFIVIGGLFGLGMPMGITGVAIAVDVMLLAGMMILFWQARAYINFSIAQIFAVPILALVLGLVVPLGGMVVLDIQGHDWRIGFVKLIIFSVIYIATLLILEYRQLSAMFLSLYKNLSFG